MTLRRISTRADRLDGGLLEPRTTPEGFLMVEARAAKPGVYPYQMPDGSIVRELVTDAVLHDPDSLGTLGGKPVTLNHPRDFVTPDSARQDVVGTVDPTLEVEAEGGFVRVRLMVHRRDGIEAIRKGDARQVSLGYNAVVDDEPGVHAVYGEYDRQQVWRGPYNHLALVPTGRHGPEVRVRADAVQHDPEHPWHAVPGSTSQEPDMNKIQIVSMLLALTPSLQRADAEAWADRVIATKADAEGEGKGPDDDKSDKMAELRKENKDLRDQLDAMRKKMKDMENDKPNEDEGDGDGDGDGEDKADAWDLPRLLRFARERAALEAAATAHKVDHDDTIDSDTLRRKVVEAARGDLVKDADDTMIRAHWHLLQQQDSADGERGWRDAFAPEGGRAPSHRADGSQSVRSVIDDAEAVQLDNMRGMIVGSDHASPEPIAS